jgi:hypothetical protein
MLGEFVEKLRKFMDRPVTLEALIRQPENSLNGTLSGIVTVEARSSLSGAANDGGDNSVSITKHGTHLHTSVGPSHIDYVQWPSLMASIASVTSQAFSTTIMSPMAVFW